MTHTNEHGRRARKRPGRIFWAESMLTGLTAVLSVLTMTWPDWIEAVTGFDPDHHGGSFEWELTLALGVLALSFAALARRSWQRTPIVPLSSP